MSNDVERYFDDFGRDLKRADAQANGPRPARTRLRIATVGVAAGLALAVGVAIVPGGDKVNVIDEARAALATTNEIVHAKYDSYAYTGPKQEKSPVTTIETWSTQKPPRERILMTEPRDELRAEFAQADGVTSTLTRGQLVRTKGQGLPAPTDQIARIRQLLAAGKLHDDGLAQWNGRPIRMLVGEDTVTSKGFTLQTPGRPPKPDTLTQTFHLQYDVDPKTYAPVRLMTVEKDPPFHSDPVTEVFEFSLYEQLETSPENLRLLSIHPPAGTKIVEFGK